MIYKKSNKKIIEFWNKSFFNFKSNFEELFYFDDIFIPCKLKEFEYNLTPDFSNLKLDHKICHKCNNTLQKSEYCSDKLFCKTCGIYA